MVFLKSVRTILFFKAAGLDHLFPLLFCMITVGVMVATVDSIVRDLVTVVVVCLALSSLRPSRVSTSFLRSFYAFFVPPTIGCMVSSSPIARSRLFARFSAFSLVSAHFCALSSLERSLYTSS